MSLTSTLFDGLETLTEIPGGPYAAAGISAVAGGTAIFLAWRALNPYPRHERRYRPALRSARPGRTTIPLEKVQMSQSPLEIPLDVVPRDEVTGLTPYDLVGVDRIRIVVDRFYSALCADAELSSFFDGIDIERLKRHQTLLIGQLWGGPVEFPLTALTDAHASLRITPATYWKVVGHLMVTLTSAGVPDWVCIFTMTRLYQARTLIIFTEEPQTHEHNPPEAGGERCACGEDETAPVHYAAPDRPAGGQP